MEPQYKFINLFLEQTELNIRDNLPEGFYDDFYNTEKFESKEEAKMANDYVTVSIATNEEGVLGYHLKRHPSEEEKFVIFSNQDPRFGEDVLDNRTMYGAVQLLLELKN